ncbi:hypothetical protein A4D02_27965 [Niastella koreensis]|uniref:Uncharacterized protein n=2 Tax=Niastella koreensis TaxID=354356 RepID=G8TJC9_NIAKG|nr:hypothetical protein Niako_3354 [Niastella koreensis GR20-10]OQP49915.1 hypothetical protein A4D02_27965 [Niastella koreensis]
MVSAMNETYKQFQKVNSLIGEFLMRSVLENCHIKRFLFTLYIAILSLNTVLAQTCPPPVTSTITSYSNTYYPRQQ